MSFSTTKEFITNPPTKLFDIPFDGRKSNGWEICIMGKSVDDIIELFDLLSGYLTQNAVAFTVATRERVADSQKGASLYQLEQSRKLLTVYCPVDMNVQILSNIIYRLTSSYKGWYDISTPSNYDHFAGGLFIRNDIESIGDGPRNNCRKSEETASKAI